MNNKTTKNTYSLYILLLILFGLFISIEKFPLITSKEQFRTIVIIFELSIQALLLVTTFIIYKNSDFKTKGVIKWLIATNVGLLCNETSWLFFVITHKPLAQDIFSFLNFTSFYIWIISIIMFLAKILHTQQRVSARKSIFILIAFAIINIIIISLFISSNITETSAINLTGITQLVRLFLQLIVYDLVILSLIYADSRGFIILLFGILTLISGNFFSSYALTNEVTNISTYGILLWPLGLIFNWIGIFVINRDKDYTIKMWIRHDTAIKSSLAFWYFIMSLAGFLVFLAISSALNLISNEIFEAMPIFLIIYSVIMIITSLWVGKIFEDPFRKIEKNIKDLLNKIEPQSANQDFQLEEFQFLQNFLLKAFHSLKAADEARLSELKTLEESKRLKLENESVQKILAEQEKFRTIVKQTLHDIQSPISSMATIIEKHGNRLPENGRITLKSAANRINDIANNLLSTYAKPTLETDLLKQTDVLVSIAIHRVISEKRYEFANLNINFEINIADAARFAFIKINQSSLKRALSNLINNAVDAIKENPTKHIKIDLTSNNNKLIIAIEDNGKGMPEHIKEKFFKQISVTEGKERGFGIGLIQVSETIKQFNGKCNIYNTPGTGTRFVIKFPLINTPAFMATEIKIYDTDTIVIIDDDPSVHGAWAEKFNNYPNIKIKHFTKATKMLEYIQHNNALNNMLLLSDYELAKQNIHGLELIKQSNIARSILVTSYADDENIQTQVKTERILLLPKELIAAIPIILKKKITPGSKIVDMVWVEDQEWFSQNIINNYYSNLIVDTYTNPEVFLEELEQYPLNTKFILDTYYFTEDNTPFVLDGFKLAEILYNKGYTKLILFSGEIITERKTPDYLQVIYKNDSLKKSQLHLL